MRARSEDERRLRAIRRVPVESGDIIHIFKTELIQDADLREVIQSYYKSRTKHSRGYKQPAITWVFRMDEMINFHRRSRSEQRVTPNAIPLLFRVVDRCNIVDLVAGEGNKESAKFFTGDSEYAFLALAWSLGKQNPTFSRGIYPEDTIRVLLPDLVVEARKGLGEHPLARKLRNPLPLRRP